MIIPRRTYGEQTVRAQRTFTDREDAHETFRQALDKPQGPDDYRVLTFYGVGGQGKSALCQELQKILRQRQEDLRQHKDRQDRHKLAVAKLDFESPEARMPDRALLSLRLQLRESGKIRFPTFDFAFARYFALTNPGVNIRQRHPELFKGDNELLMDIVEVAGDTLEIVPSLGILAKLTVKYGGRFLKWWQNRGQKLLADVEALPPYKLLEELPRYLGADMHQELFGEDAVPLERIVIFTDAYERLWENQSLKYGPGSLAADAWVRRLVAESPGVLYTIFGRDKLKWAELDRDYEDEKLLEQHLLGGLSNEDADSFLRSLDGVPPLSKPIRERIVTSAKGLPFYLDLQVTTYENILAQGRQPEPEDFGGEEAQIITRFLRHLDANVAKALEVIAHARFIDEAVFAGLHNRFLRVRVGFKEVTDQSFMEPTGIEGRFIMHALMRDYLTDRVREDEPQRFKQIHQYLFEWYDARAKVETVREITPAHEEALVEAAYHLEVYKPEDFPAWCDERAEPYYKAARYSLVEPLYYRALEIREKVLGPESPDTASSLNNLAGLLDSQGKYDEAKPLYERALEIREKVLGPEHPDTAASLNNLAGLLDSQGKYDEAKPLYERALEIREKVLEPEHPDISNSLIGLAWLLNTQGKYDEAEPLFRRALEIREKVLGPEHLDTATSLNDLAVLLDSQGRYDEAEPLYRRALEIREKVLEPEHPDISNSLIGLAWLLREKGKYDEAEPLYKRALAIREEMLGLGHPETAQSLDHLAILLHDQGKLDEAEPLQRRALAIREEMLGPEHPETAFSLYNLAGLLQTQGKYNEAEPLCHRALEIREKVLGPEHPLTRTTSENYQQLKRLLRGQDNS